MDTNKIPSSHIGIVLLAAGASRRLGQPKQLVRFGGESLVRRTARIAASTGCHPVVIVVGANAELVKAELEDGKWILAENPDWEQGMSTSLRAGLRRALEEDDQLEALLFLVADQPFLEADLLLRMIALYRQKRPPLVAAVYNDRPGVPALFDRALFPEISQVSGDQGARPLFRQYHDQLCLLPFPLGEYDLDTPSDYERIKEKAPGEGGGN